MDLYATLEFVHVVAVIVWIGGVLAVAALNMRLARGEDADASLALTRHTNLFGQAVIAPAAAVTLLAGIATAAVGGLSFAALWLVWGLAGVAVSLALGATVIRRAGERLEVALTAGETTEVTDLRRRLQVLGGVNLLVLLSVVWAMVTKPTL
ncbi:MAG: DUF2269 family protein [Nitriliruptorales bacterium]